MTPGRQGAIGVFDSGIGGLTVYKALRAVLPPDERIVYLGDTARVPYGSKSEATVTHYALEGARFFAARGVKALVVACNTMSALALLPLRRAMAGPVIGVIEPGAEAVCRVTRSGIVGVIGTSATIRSGAYPRAILDRLPGARVVARACPLFVPLAEEGWTENDVARAAAAAYLHGLRDEGLDTLVLGCTHYPLLKRVIGETIGPQVRLVDSAEATADATRELLQGQGLLRGAGGEGAAPAGGAASTASDVVDAAGVEDHFYVTDPEELFHEVGSRFLGRPMGRLEQVDLTE
ncbi:MAG TPA: glutamate racemase [Candidatus Cryosericum sp.]|nr:glutamate racemase [Candidatus Cryosericum sp.]